MRSSLSTHSTSAPASSSRRHTLACPFAAPVCSAVHPVAAIFASIVQRSSRVQSRSKVTSACSAACAIDGCRALPPPWSADPPLYIKCEGGQTFPAGLGPPSRVRAEAKCFAQAEEHQHKAQYEKWSASKQREMRLVVVHVTQIQKVMAGR